MLRAVLALLNTEATKLTTEHTHTSLYVRLRYWTSRLFFLGLDHYEFSVEILDRDESENGLITALVSVDDQYDEADFEFEREWLDGISPEELDRVIVHELLHVVMRDYDVAIASIGFLLDDTVEEVWSSRILQTRETAIDRIAKAIVECGKTS